MFALPFLRWSLRHLLPAAGLAVVAPPVSLLLAQVAVANEAETAFASLVLTGAYPALGWAFVLVGLVGDHHDRPGRPRCGPG